MIPRQDHYTPFPPQVLHGCEHRMEYRVEDRYAVMAWCNEHAGECRKDWWHPVEGIVTFRDPALRALFKLTWGGVALDSDQ
jgi:hypothetical protein